MKKGRLILVVCLTLICFLVIAEVRVSAQITEATACKRESDGNIEVVGLCSGRHAGKDVLVENTRTGVEVVLDTVQLKNTGGYFSGDLPASFANIDDELIITVDDVPPQTVHRTVEECKVSQLNCSVPFSLSDLTTPCTKTFEIYPEDMNEFLLCLALPDRLGGGEVSPDFQYASGEVSSDYGAHPDIVNLTLSLDLYCSAVLIQGVSTGQNEIAVEANGFMNISSGGILARETGIITNDIYPDWRPIDSKVIFEGLADFESDVLYLEGEGSAHFPQMGVGGLWVPVDKLGLLTPYIGVLLTIVVAIAATAIYVKRVRRREEK